MVYHRHPAHRSSDVKSSRNKLLQRQSSRVRSRNLAFDASFVMPGWDPTSKVAINVSCYLMDSLCLISFLFFSFLFFSFLFFSFLFPLGCDCSSWVVGPSGVSAVQLDHAHTSLVGPSHFQSPVNQCHCTYILPSAGSVWHSSQNSEFLNVEAWHLYEMLGAKYPVMQCLSLGNGVLKHY